MTANRKSVAPSNTAGVLPGSSTLNDITEEIEALWRHAAVPLTGVAGTANNVTANCLVPLATREAGNKFSIIFPSANTAAMTLAVNGLSSRALVNRDGSAVANGRIAPGRLELIEDDGTSYRLLLDKPTSTAAPQLSVFAYQTSTGTNGASTNGGWNKIPLNVQVLGEVTGCTLNTTTNRFTLPAGTYEIDATAFTDTAYSALHLWDVTGAAIFLTGMARVQGYAQGIRRLFGKFTLAAAKDFELRIYTLTASGSGALGYPLSIAGVPEQHAQIAIRVYP